MDDLNKTFTALPEVSCREEDDGAVLYNPDIDKAIIINPTGLMIWNHIQKPQHMNEIVNYVSEIFTEKPENIQSDIQNFLDSLTDFIRTDHDNSH